MSKQRLTEGLEMGTAYKGASFDEHMHDEAEELRDKQGKEKGTVWRNEENVSQGLEEEGTILTSLPDACICLIVSYLSPKDVARGACACLGFRNALDSDSVWDLFVPKLAAEAAGLSNELQAASKKKIFTLLCKPHLLRETLVPSFSSLAYWLDPGTGGVCYSLAAKGLWVTWGDDDRYWEWFSRPGARWPEVAYLHQVCFFHIACNLECELPPGTYTLSWRIQLDIRSSGWDSLPIEFCVSTADGSQQASSHRYLSNNVIQQTELVDLTPVRLVEDGWFEFDAGEVTVGDGERVTSLDFSMVEKTSGDWKSGIALDGVILRPSSVTRATGRYLSVDELREISEQGPLDEPHPVGLLDPRGFVGPRNSVRRVFPIRRRRVGIRLVNPNPPPQVDDGEQGPRSI